METILGVVAAVLVAAVILAALYELRVRRPDVLVLTEKKGRIGFRKGLIYPRHFSLTLKRAIYPVQLTVEATAAGNLGVRAKILGSVAPSDEHIHSLIRIGGWSPEAAASAAEQVGIFLQGLVKEYVEGSAIAGLTSSGLLRFLNERFPTIEQKFGVELVSLVVQSLDPTDPQIAEALRQQEQARLLEQTELLNQQARISAARAKVRADQEIAEMEQELELKRAELRQRLLEREAELERQRVADELERNRMRLAFEKEELELLKGSPELLMLTPQAARLAEASQSLRNARTVISLSPQDLARGAELLTFFQNLLQQSLGANKEQP